MVGVFIAMLIFLKEEEMQVTDLITGLNSVQISSSSTESFSTCSLDCCSILICDVHNALLGEFVWPL